MPKKVHQIVYPVMLEKKDILSVVNPTKCSQDAKCKFFHRNKPVTYARGFAHFQKQMFPDQYDRFSMILMGKFGRNAYYERCRGDTALTPKEQRIVLDTLKKVGVKEEMTFESYEENTNRYD